MILRNTSFGQMAEEISAKDKKIIVFGAGMIGTVTAPGILKQYGIDDRIDFYADNDKHKWNTSEPISGKKILPPSSLSETDSGRYSILLSISRFSDVLEQLDKIENIKDMSCYICPMMCITNFKPSEEDLTQHETRQPVIPKKIHYIWLGGSKTPPHLQFCIDSWKKFCPDYEIIRWDESNFDFEQTPYMKQAYENKKYGFASDSARLHILYEHGGIYLDTDVELIKSLDGMLYQSGFCCVEKWQTVNTGGGIGAAAGNRAVRELLDARGKLRLIDPDGSFNMNTCGYYDTVTMQKFGYSFSGRFQKILDMNIYPYEYFHPYDYTSGRCDITEHTYGVHHFNGGWLDENMKAANKKTSEEFEKLLEKASARKF